MGPAALTCTVPHGANIFLARRVIRALLVEGVVFGAGCTRNSCVNPIGAREWAAPRELSVLRQFRERMSPSDGRSLCSRGNWAIAQSARSAAEDEGSFAH